MSAVRTEAIGPALPITTDHPPINATSHAVRADYGLDISAGKPVRTTDADVRAVIEQASAERGLARRQRAPDEIVGRALRAMVSEVPPLLAEGVARGAGHINLVLLQGFGFPRQQGGPVFRARRWHRPALDAELQRLG